MAAATASAVFAGISSLVSSGGGLISGAISKLQDERGLRHMSTQQIPMIEDAIDVIRERIKSNEIDETEALEDLVTVFNSAEGKIRDAFMGSLKAGLQTINENAARAIDLIQFQINEAKEEADFQKKQELERFEKDIDKLSKRFKESNKQMQRSFAQRGLGASKALSASYKKSQEALGEVTTKMRERSDDVLEKISRGLAGTRRAGMFQSGQISKQAGTQSRQLSSDVANQLAQKIAGMAIEESGRKQGIRQYYTGRGDDLTAEEMALEATLGTKKAQSDYATTKTGQREVIEKKLIEQGLSPKEAEETVDSVKTSEVNALYERLTGPDPNINEGRDSNRNEDQVEAWKALGQINPLFHI